MAKKEKTKKLKYLAEDTVAKLEQKSPEELLKKARKLNKDLRSLKMQKKEDPTLQKCKRKLEQHYEKNKQNELAELEKISKTTKEIRARMKEGAEEILDEQKQRNTDFKEDMAPLKEELRVIEDLLESKL